VGSWGTGLYSGDFAADLRSTVRAVSRLPFDGERLTEIIAETESAAAFNPENEDHTTFWLVLADQFARRGIISNLVRDTTLRIIDSGQDLDMQRRLGQSATGLRKRSLMLAELRATLSAPTATTVHRATLKNPQPFLMDVGDALRYPTCGGSQRNPFVTRPDQLKTYGPGGGRPWFRDGWAAMVIVERGRAFDFFAWYRPIVVLACFDRQPALEDLRAAEWSVRLAGTCSRLHITRMEVERVGSFDIDQQNVARLFPGLRSGDRQAIADISIANRMSVHNLRLSAQRAPFNRAAKISDLEKLS